MLLASLHWSGSEMPRPSRQDQDATNHTSDTLWGRWKFHGNLLKIVEALSDVSNSVISVLCLCGCCVVSRVSVGVDFQEELSDMLLLKMLQAATRASADKDRVRLTTGHSSGFIVHFLLLNYQHVRQLLYPAAGQVECSAGAWEPTSLPAAEPSEPLCLPTAPGSSRPCTNPNRWVWRYHESQMECLLRYGERFQEPCTVPR